MNDAPLKPHTASSADLRAGVLLPLPLKGPYDYRLGTRLPRGSLVLAPLGARDALGVVWCEGEGTLEDKRLKTALPLEGNVRTFLKCCAISSIGWRTTR